MFTDRYPFSTADEWKRFELEAFTAFFDEIHVLPLHRGAPTADARLPASIHVHAPFFDQPQTFRPADGLSGGAIAQLARRPSMYDAKLGLRKTKLFLSSWGETSHILASHRYRTEVAPLLERGRLYFFWGRGWASILPTLRPQQRAASLVRFHGFDLYADRSGGYIPLQAPIVRSAALCAAVSENGTDYLREHYPDRAAHIRCLRLGTVPQPAGPIPGEGPLRLLSCAHAVPVKRLHLIPSALRHATRPVEWTHIGDGPDLPALKQAAAQLPAHVTAEFTGALLPQEVPALYQRRGFDMLLNVSSSEGVPVSIMEAMAAGIPALATNVGGTSELVRPDCGSLVPASIDPRSLWEAIARFAGQSPEAINAIRRNARARIADAFDIHANARKVAEALLLLPEVR
jgi:colanic acid/amylovoran biosynthesis glycosyltransferase